MQSGLIWYDNVAVKLDRVSRLQDIASGRPGSKQRSDIQLHMQFWFQLGVAMLRKILIGSWDFGIVPLGIQGANKARLFYCICSLIQFDRAMRW